MRAAFFNVVTCVQRGNADSPSITASTAPPAQNSMSICQHKERSVNTCICLCKAHGVSLCAERAALQNISNRVQVIDEAAGSGWTRSPLKSAVRLWKLLIRGPHNKHWADGPGPAKSMVGSLTGFPQLTATFTCEASWGGPVVRMKASVTVTKTVWEQCDWLEKVCWLLQRGCYTRNLPVTALVTSRLLQVSGVCMEDIDTRKLTTSCNETWKSVSRECSPLK